jgi:PTH2 family peptidyl-tRNA hydrolase
VREVKQVIVIRKDLKMRRGKEIAQGGHAACAPLERYMGKKPPKELTQWLEQGRTKICLQGENEDQMRAVLLEAQNRMIPNYTIIDSGKTEFGGEPTFTALSLGPYYSDEIDKITGPGGTIPLKLY